MVTKTAYISEWGLFMTINQWKPIHRRIETKISKRGRNYANTRGLETNTTGGKAKTKTKTQINKNGQVKSRERINSQAKHVQE